MITFLTYCIDKINQRHSGSSFILLRALTWHNGGLNLTLSMALIICAPTVTLAEVPLKRGFTKRSFILLWPGQSSDDAQLDLDAPLVTDRPNFTDAASTVGRGVSQIEFGYTYFYNEANPGKGSANTYPEAAFRYGALRDWIELRLRQSLITQDISGDSSTSLGNTYLGTKLGLLPQYGLLPQISVQPQMTLPTGSGDSRTKHILPGINMLFFWTLADKTFLTGSSQVNRSDTKDVSDVNTIWHIQPWSALRSTHGSPVLSSGTASSGNQSLIVRNYISRIPALCGYTTTTLNLTFDLVRDSKTALAKSYSPGLE